MKYSPKGKKYLKTNDRPWIRPVIQNYRVASPKITHGFRIVHLSDLHCCCYGAHQKTLVTLIDGAAPDMVCMTGDMLEPRFSRTTARELFGALVEKYPCYLVMGNHEYNYKNYPAARSFIQSFGIHLLDAGHGEHQKIGGQEIFICGIDDPMAPDRSFKRDLKHIAAKAAQSGRFTLFLTHRPELAPIYARLPFDLVLSGHAHGGQWRVPGLINGVFAPSQGLFPKCAGGRYDLGGQVHINSRGLAYYVPIPRLFNPVEFGVIDVVPDGEKN